jgi:scytalone dehydratase
MPFEIYIPGNLSFHDYISVVQTARVWADGYDQKVGPHLP